MVENDTRSVDNVTRSLEIADLQFTPLFLFAVTAENHASRFREFCQDLLEREVTYLGGLDSAITLNQNTCSISICKCTICNFAAR